MANPLFADRTNNVDQASGERKPSRKRHHVELSSELKESFVAEFQVPLSIEDTSPVQGWAKAAASPDEHAGIAFDFGDQNEHSLETLETRMSSMAVIELQQVGHSLQLQPPHAGHDPPTPLTTFTPIGLTARTTTHTLEDCPVKTPLVKRNKKGFVWTDELHLRFLLAMKSIGMDKATNTKIHKEMDVDGITPNVIRDHLYSYRKHKLKKPGTSGDVGTEDRWDRDRDRWTHHRDAMETVLTQDIADMRSRCIDPASATRTDEQPGPSDSCGEIPRVRPRESCPVPTDLPCDRCPKGHHATFQLRDHFDEDARMLCSGCAHSAVHELPGGELRHLVPLAHLFWTSDIVEALLVHLFTQAPALPGRASRVELATSLFMSLRAGNVPKLPVPLPSRICRTWARPNLESWKNATGTRILLTRFVDYILSPDASNTTRSHGNYTGPQLALLRLIPAATATPEQIAAKVKVFIHRSGATRKCLGVSSYIGTSVLAAGRCLQVDGVSCEKSPVPISSQEVRIRRTTTTTRRLAVLLIVESKNFLHKCAVQYYDALEQEAAAAIEGFDGVDIIILTPSGQPGALFGLVATYILTQLHKQWDGQVVVAHRCDTDAGKEPGSRACAGDIISASILSDIKPVTGKYGIHTYRAFNGKLFQDLHVDQLPLLSAIDSFAEYFASELAEQVEERPQHQPVAVAELMEDQLAVAQREWPIHDVRVDAEEFAEFILDIINKVVAFQANKQAEVQKEILYKNVRRLVKSIVRSFVDEQQSPPASLTRACAKRPRGSPGRPPLSDTTNVTNKADCQPEA